MTMHEDDIPGYLMDALHSAQERGLRRLNFTYTGQPGSLWQASSLWTDSGGYYVVRDDDMVQAAFKALAWRSAASQDTPPAEAAIGLFN